MAEQKLQVMISSTVKDLEEYRAEAKDACLKCGMFPDLMENRPAQDTEAITASKAMVDKADIYVGIFAHRYGYTPKENNPSKISITEMEYNRAVELGIPRLVFLIKENHPFDPSYVDKGKDATKLANLRKRLATERVVLFFTTPEDLRGHIVSSLGELKRSVSSETAPKQSAGVDIRDIPAPPEKYIAHPYLLLQTPELIGRRKELDLLNQWVSEPESEIYDRNIFSFVAIGGLGKSALTWQWFNKIAPEQMKPLAGRMWWSFYDREAYFEKFILHTLAYVSDSLVKDVREIPAPERETKLLAALNQKPYLIVFDGFERVLNSYSGADAARLDDNEVDTHGNARKTADPRVGQFLKRLAQVKNSRILISTRLQPAELETDAAKPVPGVFKYDLDSLSDDDAVTLWQALGVEGSRSVLLPVFRSFGKHTLLIQALSGEIVNYRRGPNNFDKWREANPHFDPMKFDDLKDRMAHALHFALEGLDEKSRSVLNTIAAFRMPTGYDTISAILVGDEKLCADEKKLDDILKDLENRGLIGWDKLANRYDLHPIVRGVVWSGLGDDARQVVYTSLHAHFEALPMIEDWRDVENLEDLTPAIELFHALIGMKRYQDAFIVFCDRLEKATLHRLSVNRQVIEWLELFFPDGLDQSPPLSGQIDQAIIFNSLALGYKFSGQLEQGISLFFRVNTICAEMGDNENLGIGLANLSFTLRLTGKMRSSEILARQALIISRNDKNRNQELINLYMLGLTLAAVGVFNESESALQRSLRFVRGRDGHSEALVNSFLAQRSLWSGEYTNALSFGNHAWKFAETTKTEGAFIRAARPQGEAFLGVDDFLAADERLYHALTRARAVNYVEEELPALTALAELRGRQGDEKAAREFLENVWEFAERGPYPLLHADALNVLAQIERDAGNKDKAIEAATRAYELSWCDGPPYAYHWGLVKARKHLEELGAPLPEMKPFNEADYEPMPEVEIDPDDEFHVGDSS